MNKKGCLTLIGLVAVVVLLGLGILVFFAWRAGPEKTIQESLATLPGAERGHELRVLHERRQRQRAKARASKAEIVAAVLRIS